MDLVDPDPLPLFPDTALKGAGAGLDAFRRRYKHRTATTPPDPRGWAAAHPCARGRTPAGTVHEVNDNWLPACGAGLNTWDFKGLQATEDAVTCGRCVAARLRREPAQGQLALFEVLE